MEQLRDTTDILEAARLYAALGLPIIPLKGKTPAVRDWQKFFATAGPNRNQVRRDVEPEAAARALGTDTEEADQWARGHLPETPMRARSGGGSTHRYFAKPPRKEIRNRQGWNGIRGLDVRGQGGFIVLPPSVHPGTGKRYEWVTDFWLASGLPRFSPRWIYERTRRRVRQEVLDTDLNFAEYRASEERWMLVREEEAQVDHRGSEHVVQAKTRRRYLACCASGTGNANRPGRRRNSRTRSMTR